MPQCGGCLDDENLQPVGPSGVREWTVARGGDGGFEAPAGQLVHQPETYSLRTRIRMVIGVEEQHARSSSGDGSRHGPAVRAVVIDPMLSIRHDRTSRRENLPGGPSRLSALIMSEPVITRG
jgi:hypothetical protein